MQSCDALVIGGGPAGINAARVLNHRGKNVVLVEERLMGGDCTNVGCVPSKTFIRLAALWHESERAREAGITSGSVVLDFPAVMAQVRRVVAMIREYENPPELEREGISVVLGRARFVEPHMASIGGEKLTFQTALICTGSRPAIPRVPGLDRVPFLTNETVFDLNRRIENLVVIGAGPVGLELAQAFARLGSHVTVIDVMSRILAKEDPELTGPLAQMLSGEGLEILLGVQIESVVNGSYGLEVQLRQSDRALNLPADAVLVAAGRSPAVDGLDLHTVGVQTHQGGIRVDDELRTTAEGIYAAGDVTGLSGFTHLASYQGGLAARNATGQHRHLDQKMVPQAVFTDPEYATVGLNEAQAREAGLDIETVVFPVSAVDRALIDDRPAGLMKLVAARGSSRRLLGAQLLCPHASELIHELALTIAKEESAAFLASTLHAYPTMALGLQQAAACFFASGRALSGPLRQELASPPTARTQ